MRSLSGVFERTIGEAVDQKELGNEVDAKASAWQIFGLYSAHHTMQRLMRDREADAVALQGFETLVRAARGRQV